MQLAVFVARPRTIRLIGGPPSVEMSWAVWIKSLFTMPYRRHTAWRPVSRLSMSCFPVELKWRSPRLFCRFYRSAD